MVHELYILMCAKQPDTFEECEKYPSTAHYLALIVTTVPNSQMKYIHFVSSTPFICYIFYEPLEEAW